MAHEKLDIGGGPPVHTDIDTERLQRKRDAALGYRIMASWGWGADGSGHITARDPERTDCFWLLGYGVPFGEATIDDLVLVDHDGEVIDGELDINHAAFYIHQPIHTARPDVVGAIHMHTPYGTPYAEALQPLGDEVDAPLASGRLVHANGRSHAVEALAPWRVRRVGLHQDESQGMAWRLADLHDCFQPVRLVDDQRHCMDWKERPVEDRQEIEGRGQNLARNRERRYLG